MEAAQSASSSGRKYRTESIMSGRLYRAHDMARIASTECAGCGACCRGMGDTIVLDPYDVWQLTENLGQPFERLMGKGIDLHVEEGVILPHLLMREGSESCFFLGEDGRCAIHAFRPGICRLFPLGRQFDGDKVAYFVVEGGCIKGNLAKTRIDKWLGIPGLPAYERFKADWHQLLGTLRARIASEPSEEVQRNINVYFLRTFYMTPCSVEKSAADFYRELGRRIEDFKKAVL